MVIDKIGRGIGKITRKVSGLEPKIIEWTDSTPEDLVWRYPDEIIPWGSVVVVHEWERAVFYRDGKVYGVLGPGRHVLDTQNVPFLKGLVEGFYGESIFRATIIFVNINRFQGKFGGQAQTTELIPVRFYGVYYYRVSDPNLFVNKVVGPDERYTREELDEYIRSYFLSKLISFISQCSIRDLYLRIEETSRRAAVTLRKAFDELGLMLEDVRIEGIDVPREYREKMFWLIQGVSAPYYVQQETARRLADAIGRGGGGAAFGAGLVAIPWILQPPPQQAYQRPQQPGAATYVPRCPYCGKGPIPYGARYCPYCGKEIKWCPNKHVVSKDTQYCPICGAKIE